MTTIPRAVALLALGAACAAPRAQGGGVSTAAGAAAPPTAGPAAPAAAVAPDEASGLWRAARWGMSVEELLVAFPGEARRLDPEIRLADGDVVAAGVDGQVVAGHPLVVRFVFTDGGLSIVSLRSPAGAYAGERVYRDLQAHLKGRLGAPTYEVVEKPFVEQRQTRWALARGVVDLKAIPGTVVLMYSASPPATPPAAPGASSAGPSSSRAPSSSRPSGPAPSSSSSSRASWPPSS